jgi:hypothetical protein
VNPRKTGHARSTAVQVSRHGNKAIYGLPISVIFGFREGVLVFCGTSAESGRWALPPVGSNGDDSGLADPGDGSEHRVNDTEQSHLR